MEGRDHGEPPARCCNSSDHVPNPLAYHKNREKQCSRKAQQINCRSDFSCSFLHMAPDPSPKAPDKSRQPSSDPKNSFSKLVRHLLLKGSAGFIQSTLNKAPLAYSGLTIA